MKEKTLQKGFTIIELLISIFIISLFAVTATVFERDIFSLNFSLQNNLNAQLDARHIVKNMVAELRATEPSSLGAYPIVLASTTAITFYTDINGDSIKERIRYFLSGTSLKRGVLAPTGNPLTYVDANEKLTTVVSNAVSSSTVPIFQYYSSSYAGTSTPLVQPVNISSVRLVKITVIIEKDPNKSPVPIVVTSQVSLRNLKDNL